MFTFGLPRDYWILIFSLFLINMFGLGFSPFLVYFLREIGAGVSETAFVLAFSRVAYTLLLVFGGWVVDLVGRRLPLVLGPMVIGVSYFALAGAKSWSDAIIPLTFSFLPTAFTAPAVFAYIGDVVDEARLGRAYGAYFAAMNLSAILGYLIIGYLIEEFGYTFCLMSIGVSSILTALVRFWLRESRKAPIGTVVNHLREAYGQLRHRFISLLILTRGLYLGLEATVGTVIIPLWAREIVSLSESQLSLIFVVESAFYSILAPIGGRMVESRRWWLRLSLLELMVKIPAILILVSASTFLVLLVVMVLHSGLAIFLIPSLDSRLSSRLALIHRGTMWGLQQAVTSVASISLTLVGGYMWELLGAVNAVFALLSGPFVMISLVMALARLEERDRKFTD